MATARCTAFGGRRGNAGGIGGGLRRAGWLLAAVSIPACDGGDPKSGDVPIDAGDVVAEADADDAADVDDGVEADGSFWGDGPVDVRFPDGFLWGSASAAYQVEGTAMPDGGTAASNWSEWEELNHIADLQRSGRGSGFWDLYGEDLDRAVSLGHDAVRIGIDWARIEPQDDAWDDGALDHYLAVIRAARERGLSPFVTLYHWVVPVWIQSPRSRIDLLNADDTAFEEAFDDFVRHVVPVLAGEVDFWVTLNEPFSVITAGYLVGEHPPGGVLDMEAAQRVGVRFVFAHARACAAIRELDLEDADGDTVPARVGVAQVANLFPPKNSALEADRIASERIEYIVNDVFPEAWTSGRLDVNMDGDFDDAATIPPEGTYPEVAGTLDWIGVNYYGPGRAEGGAFARIEPMRGLPIIDVRRYDPALPHNEMNREISAPGFLDTLRRYRAWGLPIYVTENGIGDSDDSQRPFYLLEHVRVIGAAIAEGIDVRGYLHWSLTDNFEWSHGFHQRFGLYRIDFEDSLLPRAETGAARLYRAITALGGIDDGIWTEWALDRYPTDTRGGD
jgi:beta-glucosidase